MLTFSTEPPAIVQPNTNFAAALLLSESGSPFPVSGVKIPIGLAPGSGGSLNVSSLKTNSSGIAGSSQLQISAFSAADKLLVALPLTTTPPPAPLTSPITLSATSNPFTVGVAAQPALTPGNGTYSATVMVKITDPTPGAIIYYTTDGTTPGRSSPVYKNPIPISSPTVLKAIAILGGYFASPEAAAKYAFAPPAATPTFSPAGGSYTTTQAVKITDTTPGANIYYTTNGTPPTTSSTRYTGGSITVSSTETLEAIAIATNYAQSAVARVVFTIMPQAAQPILTPGNGTYTGPQMVRSPTRRPEPPSTTPPTAPIRADPRRPTRASSP